MALNDQSTMQLTLTAEFETLSSKEAHSSLCMASVCAPDAADDARAPMELVAVVDRSGSMSGAKMKLMKETLEFVVNKGLNSTDSFSIVAYDNTVDTRLPLRLMDAKGKAQALEVIRKLQTGGATNLSGGLLQGIDVAAQSEAADGTTKAVMLFTDGLANNGITDNQGIVQAMSGALTAAPNCSVFTFGFGADHSEDMLRGIADEGKGLYYFIEGSDTIPQAFADCLGGLVSVVAQNTTLCITAHGDVRLEKVLATYKTEMNDERTECVLQLNDLYAEDEKDVLLQVHWPALDAPGDSELSATLKCFNVVTSSMETTPISLKIARPEQADASQPVNQKLDVQRNRIQAAEAMEAATRLADAGDLQQGGEVLRNARAKVLASPSAQADLSQDLMADLEKCEAGFVDRERYRSYGSKMSKMAYSSNMQQRCTHNIGGAYEKKSKMRMKSAFTPTAEELVDERLEERLQALSAPPMQPPPQAPAQAPQPSQGRGSFFGSMGNIFGSPRNSANAAAPPPPGPPQPPPGPPLQSQPLPLQQQTSPPQQQLLVAPMKKSKKKQMPTPVPQSAEL